jgi:hypothetical protein
LNKLERLSSIREERKPIKKDTITLSIDANILEALKEDAQANMLSVNAAINRILTKYVNFYKRAEEYGSAVIVSTQFSVFIDLMDEEKVTEIMQTDGTATMIAYFQHNNIPITLDSIINIAFANVALISGVCTKFSQHRDQEGFRYLVFDHRYGLKWSRIISKAFSYLLKKTCDIDTSVKLLPQTISIKILQRD